MNIQRAVRRDIEDRWRQKHAVSDNHYGIRACGANACRGLGRLQGFRLEDWQAMQSGEALDRTGRSLLTASRGAIRLGEHQRDVMAGSVQGR
jgi:hypothetical protein